MGGCATGSCTHPEGPRACPVCRWTLEPSHGHAAPEETRRQPNPTRDGGAGSRRGVPAGGGPAPEEDDAPGSFSRDRDRSRQPPQWPWPTRRVIWSCRSARGPLLTRYYLILTRRGAVYLHHLHASDEDRALHDHPWSFVTWLIGGGYYEHTPAGRCWRRRFSVLWRPAEYRHRLVLTRPTWTLVVRFRRRRAWGFWLPSGWLHSKAYGETWCDE